MSTADPLQQETGHFCLPVKLCLRHSKLLLSLSGKGSPESSASFLPALPLPSRNTDACPTHGSAPIIDTQRSQNHLEPVGSCSVRPSPD